jgi:acetyltransferase-like isoleucine patch superfamily enzyme
MSSKLKNTGRRVLYAGIPVPRAIRPVIRWLYGVGVLGVEGFVLLRKLIWIEPVLRSVCDKVGENLRAERLPYIRGPGSMELGNHVNLSGRSCFYFMRGMPARPVIRLGDHVFLGNGCTLSAAAQITIGDHCLLSAAVRVHDNDGHPLDAEKRRRSAPIGPDDVAPVRIDENVWIGAEATILKGVHIGRDAVVGTGAVVTADVPAGAVVAGNPARVVRP